MQQHTIDTLINLNAPTGTETPTHVILTKMTPKSHPMQKYKAGGSQVDIYIKKNIRFLRKEKGHSQQVLGRLLNCKRETISYFESQKRSDTPNIAQLILLSIIYLYSVDSLIHVDLESSQDEGTLSQYKIDADDIFLTSPDDLNTPLRNNIKFWRHLYNMTQEEFAEAMHISGSSLSAYERGELEISIEILTSLSDYLGIDIDTLVKVDLGVCTKANRFLSEEIRYIYIVGFLQLFPVFTTTENIDDEPNQYFKEALKQHDKYLWKLLKDFDEDIVISYRSVRDKYNQAVQEDPSYKMYALANKMSLLFSTLYRCEITNASIFTDLITTNTDQDETHIDRYKNLVDSIRADILMIPKRMEPDEYRKIIISIKEWDSDASAFYEYWRYYFRLQKEQYNNTKLFAIQKSLIKIENPYFEKYTGFIAQIVNACKSGLKNSK